MDYIQLRSQDPLAPGWQVSIATRNAEHRGVVAEKKNGTVFLAAGGFIEFCLYEYQ